MRYGRYFVDGGVTGGKGEESTLPDAKMKMSLWQEICGVEYHHYGINPTFLGKCNMSVLITL